MALRRLAGSALMSPPFFKQLRHGGAQRLVLVAVGRRLVDLPAVGDLILDRLDRLVGRVGLRRGECRAADLERILERRNDGAAALGAGARQHMLGVLARVFGPHCFSSGPP
jgi:hypothetical protein